MAAALALWPQEVEYSRAVVAAGFDDLAAVVRTRDGRPYGPVNLRWILVRTMEESARH